MRRCQAPGKTGDSWINPRPRDTWRALTLLLMLLIVGPALRGADEEGDATPGARFEAANAMYETGRYLEAAQAYHALAEEGAFSPALYLNLGNAWFKAGRNGRAVAAYRLGLRLAPRDPDLRFNLNHVQEKLSVDPLPLAGGVAVWLTRLTLDEWGTLVLVLYWIWALLLVTGEWRPAAKRALRGYTASAGIAAALLLGCLLLANRAWSRQVQAVVVVPEAVVRYGPLEESKMFYQLTDGSEVWVLDELKGDTPWVEIRARDGREGWVKREEVVMLQFPG